MRRICALLLTAAFGLGVVGCGEAEKPAPKKETPPVKKDEKTKPTDTTTPATGEKPKDTTPAK